MENKVFASVQNNNARNLCNYHCPECQKTGKIPNIAGRFFIIDEQHCKCNACNTVFDKKDFYKDIRMTCVENNESNFKID